jgi:hypothetical protein
LDLEKLMFGGGEEKQRVIQKLGREPRIVEKYEVKLTEFSG